MVAWTRLAYEGLSGETLAKALEKSNDTAQLNQFRSNQAVSFEGISQNSFRHPICVVQGPWRLYAAST